MAGEESNNYLVFRGTVGFFVKSNPKKQKNNQHQSGNYQNIGIDCPEINIIHNSSSSSILTVIVKNSIPSIRSYVNNQRTLGFVRPAKFGIIITAPNQAADKEAVQKADEFLREI